MISEPQDEPLTRIIHDGSLRNRPVALRDGRVEPRGRETYSLQYVDRLSGEPARLHAEHAAAGLSQQRMGGYPLLREMQRVDSRSAHE